MNILIASVAKQVDEIYLPHLKTLEWQDGDYVRRLHVIADGLSWTARDALFKMGATVSDPPVPKPANARYGVSETTHEWSVETFHWLAALKQRILNYGRHFDAVFLVDSDLFLAPDTLRLLIEADKPVVSGVFWTKWKPDLPELPNVWQEQPYGFGDDPVRFFSDLRGDRPVQIVGGLGACTLISRWALERGAAFLPLYDTFPKWGMWQGEDRHFSNRCREKWIEMWADPRPQIWHCYRPSDIQKIPEVMERLATKQEATSGH